MNFQSGNFGPLLGEQPEWNTQLTDDNTPGSTLETVTNGDGDHYANFYGNNVYHNQWPARSFDLMDRNQDATSASYAMNQFMDFHAGEQATSFTQQQQQQQFTSPFPQFQPAADLTGPNYAQQPVLFQQFGMDTPDVHHTCRQTEARDRARIARLEYSVQNLHNFIRLREEEHELAIQALNEQIDRRSLGRRTQMRNDSPLEPQSAAPPAPPPAVIDLDEYDDLNETDTPDTPPSRKRVKRSHSSLPWLTPPASDALKRATGWLATPTTTVEPRRSVAATPTTSVETEDDAEADFLAHWNAAEEETDYNTDTVDEA